MSGVLKGNLYMKALMPTDCLLSDPIAGDEAGNDLTSCKLQRRKTSTAPAPISTGLLVLLSPSLLYTYFFARGGRGKTRVPLNPPVFPRCILSAIINSGSTLRPFYVIATKYLFLPSCFLFLWRVH